MTEALTYVEIDCPRCINTYGVSPCRARLMDDAYTQVGVNFDGTNDYLLRGADFGGSSDSVSFIFSAWFRVNGGNGTNRIIFANSGGFFFIQLTTANKLQIGGADSGAVNILNYISNTTFLAGEGWHHVLVNVKLDIGRLQVFIDNQSDAGSTATTSSASIDFTRPNWSVGADVVGGSKFNGDLGDVWFYIGATTGGFTTEAGRSIFVSADVKPVDLGSNGSTPFSSTPTLYLSGALAAWHTNKGTGGGFTLTGSLTAAAGGSGPIKCFNTRNTCQDINNYADDEPLLLRFAKPTSYLPKDIFAIPSLLTVDLTPAVVSLGKDLGQRASVSVTFEDHPDDDTGGLQVDGYTRLLLHFGGADASTTLTDERGHAFSVAGNAQIDTADSKFGGSSGLFDGSGDFWSTPSSADLELWDHDFTIECFFKCTVATGTYRTIAGQTNPGYTTDSSWILRRETSGTMAFYIFPGGAAIQTASTFSDTVNAGWHHVAVTRSGNTLYIFIDGVLESTASYSIPIPTSTVPLCIGERSSGGGSEVWLGWIDEFRLTIGRARYTSAFTPPTAAFGTGEELAIPLDPYLEDRDYDPFEQGTFWGKFKARNPFIIGAPIRLIFGTTDQDLIDMETRHYIIDSYEGPTPRGKFTIRASDVLKLGDADKAQAPLPSNGFLSANITAVQTSITLLPAGVGAEYASGLPQYLNIGGKEIVNCTARAGDTLTITRGQLNTTAVTANSGDRVQKILKYVSVDPANIVYDLCVNYIPGFDPSWITLASWQSETATYNGNVYTGYVTEPTAVKTLLEELVLQCALAIWWDDVNEQLRLQVLHAIPTSAFDFTPDNMRRGSLAINENLGSRLSQVFIYFSQLNPLIALSNKDNFRSSTVVEDTDAEANWGQPAIQTILSRWIPSAGRTVADRLGAIILGRYKTPPRSVSFDVQRFAETDPVLGGGYHFACDFVQDETGATENVFIPIQVTELKAASDSYSVKAEEMLFDVPAVDLTNRNVTFAANNFNLNLRTEHDSIYPAPTGSETVTFTLNAGVRIGSTSAANPSVDVGTWPAGTTIAIVLDTGARIQGMGGQGGAQVGTIFGAAGAAGGKALYTRKAITLTNNGMIAGGGGGGGATGFNPSGEAHPELAGAGGGGAGINGGAGGSSPWYPGAPGSADAGGVGGSGLSIPGGTGGGPGQAGAAGYATGYQGAGGAAGAGVDGHSFVTYSLAGDIRGGQIN